MAQKPANTATSNAKLLAAVSRENIDPAEVEAALRAANTASVQYQWLRDYYSATDIPEPYCFGH